MVMIAKSIFPFKDAALTVLAVVISHSSKIMANGLSIS
jgi:hypothetical protein